MPEGDAVLRTAQRLHAALADHRLAYVDLRWGGVDGACLRGAATLEVVSLGKHLLHRTDNGFTLHTHLRMDGRWRTLSKSKVTAAQRNSSKLRVLVATEHQAALGWQLGLVEVLRTDRELEVLGHLGPDLLGPRWDEDQAVTRLRAQPDRPLAEALLDQRNLAGLGTIFTSEPLFLEGLDPWSPVAQVGEDQLSSLLRRARAALRASVRTGEPLFTGDPRQPTYVFGRLGQACRRCGTQVQRGTVGVAPQERVLSYCPTCQRTSGSGNNRRVRGRDR